MRILLTGGCGFIGSNLVRTLLSDTNAEVVNLDCLTYAGSQLNLEEVADNKRYMFDKTDISDIKAVQKAFAKYIPDKIIHLAAESHVDRSIDGPDLFIRTNINGTFNLLKTATEYWENLVEDKKRQFRFLHISTDEVFGDLEDGAPAFSETTNYSPNSPYSASKAAADHLVRAWHRTYGLPVLLTNCSNNYGPYQHPEKLIPTVIIRALNKQPIPVYGDGKQVRDWLYVQDHIDALLQILFDAPIGETYNIGGSNPMQNIDIIREICTSLEKLTSHEKLFDLVEYVSDRPGHDRRYEIDARKIETELGWKPKENKSSGLLKTVEWYLQNQEWCQSVVSGKAVLNRIGLGVNR